MSAEQTPVEAPKAMSAKAKAPKIPIPDDVSYCKHCKTRVIVSNPSTKVSHSTRTTSKGNVIESDKVIFQGTCPTCGKKNSRFNKKIQTVIPDQKAEEVLPQAEATQAQ